MNKFTVFTHADLDGAGCAILLRHFMNKNIDDVIFTGLEKIDKNIKKILTCDSVIITDLSLAQHQINTIDHYVKNVMLIDHHESSRDLDIPFKNIINMKGSGTLLTAAWLTKKGFKLSNKMSKLVKLIDDYDLWILKHPESILLNNIYWELGPFDFVDYFINGISDFLDENSDLHKKALKIQDNKSAEINAFDTWDIEGLVRIVTADNHISDIQLHFPENDIIIIKPHNMFSIRSSKDLTQFYKVLTAAGAGSGGHKFAGGGKYNTSCEIMEVIEMFYEFVKE